MKWNYRVIQFMDGGEPYLRVHEVYYGDDGKPCAYGQNVASIESETTEGIGHVLDEMKRALELPILKAADFVGPSCPTSGLLPPPGFSNWLNYVVANTGAPRDINLQSLFEASPWGREVSRDEVRAAINDELAMLRKSSR